MLFRFLRIRIFAGDISRINLPNPSNLTQGIPGSTDEPEITLYSPLREYLEGSTDGPEINLYLLLRVYLQVQTNQR